MGTKRIAEIRHAAVRVALSGGLTRKQVASETGVLTLSGWSRQDRMTLPEPSVQSDLRREVAMLRKNNRLLREKREALKKGHHTLCGTKAMRFRFIEENRVAFPTSHLYLFHLPPNTGALIGALSPPDGPTGP